MIACPEQGRSAGAPGETGTRKLSVLTTASVTNWSVRF